MYDKALASAREAKGRCDMAVDIGRVRKGMRVRSSDKADLGKVAEVWLGTDPTAANVRCDEELCSRIEVHHGLLRKQVLYIPYNAIDTVGDAGVVLTVGEKKAKGWLAAPKWLSQA